MIADKFSNHNANLIPVNSCDCTAMESEVVNVMQCTLS